jgi:D-3-phosphoglycerate dehydrogenase
MTDDALRMLESAGRILWSDCKNENELIQVVREAKAKVIISEYFRISSQIVNASTALRGVVVWGIGYDHVDVGAASSRGIYVANTRGSNSESVAEHVWAFVISLSRRLPWANTFVHEDRWATKEETGLPVELESHDLYGKTIGIVGLGSIGSIVARIAQGFNMKVLAYDPYLKAEVAEKKGAELVSLDRLLQDADYVTLHTVLTDKTKGMIGKKELEQMKPTACLINASRGAVVCEKDLIEALRERKIAGAGLDVFQDEPIDSRNPLLGLPNVIVSPHCAGNSEEAMHTTSLMVSEETVEILRDEVPKNLVNKFQLEKNGYLSGRR